MFVCYQICFLLSVIPKNSTVFVFISDSPQIEVIKHESPFHALSKVVAGHTHL